MGLQLVGPTLLMGPSDALTRSTAAAAATSGRDNGSMATSVLRGNLLSSLFPSKGLAKHFSLNSAPQASAAAAAAAEPSSPSAVAATEAAIRPAFYWIEEELSEAERAEAEARALGYKAACQDEVLVVERLGGSASTSLLGVFDGHGPDGRTAAAFAASHLAATLAGDSRLRPAAREASSKKARQGSDRVRLAALGEAVLAADAALSDRRRSGADCSFSGTTACLALLCGRRLYVANTGDSRAVLARDNGEGGLVASQLSWTARPEHPDEMARISAAGGVVGQLPDEAGIAMGAYRVFHRNARDLPGLAMSRSLGDIEAHGLGVSPAPVTRCLQLSDADSFLVLATDGLWDVMSNEEVVSFAGQYRAAPGAAFTCADALTLQAQERWKARHPEVVVDDVAVVVAHFRPLPARTPPPALTRHPAAASNAAANSPQLFADSRSTAARVPPQQDLRYLYVIEPSLTAQMGLSPFDQTSLQAMRSLPPANPFERVSAGSFRPPTPDAATTPRRRVVAVPALQTLSPARGSNSLLGHQTQSLPLPAALESLPHGPTLLAFGGHASLSAGSAPEAIMEGEPLVPPMPSGLVQPLVYTGSDELQPVHKAYPSSSSHPSSDASRPTLPLEQDASTPSSARSSAGAASTSASTAAASTRPLVGILRTASAPSATDILNAVAAAGEKEEKARVRRVRIASDPRARSSPPLDTPWGWRQKSLSAESSPVLAAALGTSLADAVGERPAKQLGDSKQRGSSVALAALMSGDLDVEASSAPTSSSTAFARVQYGVRKLSGEVVRKLSRDSVRKLSVESDHSGSSSGRHSRGSDPSSTTASLTNSAAGAPPASLVARKRSTGSLGNIERTFKGGRAKGSSLALDMLGRVRSGVLADTANPGSNPSLVSANPGANASLGASAAAASQKTYTPGGSHREGGGEVAHRPMLATRSMPAGAHFNLHASPVKRLASGEQLSSLGPSLSDSQDSLSGGYEKTLRLGVPKGSCAALQQLVDRQHSGSTSGQATPLSTAHSTPRGSLGGSLEWLGGLAGALEKTCKGGVRRGSTPNLAHASMLARSTSHSDLGGEASGSGSGRHGSAELSRSSIGVGPLLGLADMSMHGRRRNSDGSLGEGAPMPAQELGPGGGWQPNQISLAELQHAYSIGSDGGVGSRGASALDLVELAEKAVHAGSPLHAPAMLTPPHRSPARHPNPRGFAPPPSPGRRSRSAALAPPATTPANETLPNGTDWAREQPLGSPHAAHSRTGSALALVPVPPLRLAVPLGCAPTAGLPPAEGAIQGGVNAAM